MLFVYVTTPRSQHFTNKAPSLYRTVVEKKAMMMHCLNFFFFIFQIVFRQVMYFVRKYFSKKYFLSHLPRSISGNSGGLDLDGGSLCSNGANGIRFTRSGRAGSLSLDVIIRCHFEIVFTNHNDVLQHLSNRTFFASAAVVLIYTIYSL